MRAASHRQLGIFLADRYFPNISSRNLRVFLFGCTQPDKNPTTYLKGSIRHSFLHGHSYQNAKNHILRLVRRLQNRSHWIWLDYYNFGKLIHYLSDTFTHAHNEHFHGSLLAHRRYEKLLQKHFFKRLMQHPSPSPELGRSLTETIEAYYRLYRLSPPSIPTDTDYIIGICCLAAKTLIFREKSDFSSFKPCNLPRSMV